MAAAKPTEIVQEEATCSICLEFFTDPVMTECGHNFCRDCIKMCCGDQDTHSSCPQCRENFLWKNLKPNRVLVSVVEAAKQMKSEAENPLVGRFCEVHNEELKLYCLVDEKALCVVCVGSREHRGHTAVPIEEATEEYKLKLQTYIPVLRRKCNNLKICREHEEARIINLMTEIETQKTLIKSEMKKLHQRLHDEEEALLQRLDEVEACIIMLVTNVIGNRSDEISSYSELIAQIEAKCQQPASEFIQDANYFLSRIQEQLEETDDEIQIPDQLEERNDEIQIEELLDESDDETVKARTNAMPVADHTREGKPKTERYSQWEHPWVEPPLLVQPVRIPALHDETDDKIQIQEQPEETDDEIQIQEQLEESHDEIHPKDAEVRRMSCIYNFVARESTELSVMAGDVLQVIDDSQKFWKMQNSYGEEGYVPGNILAPVTTADVIDDKTINAPFPQNKKPVPAPRAKKTVNPQMSAECGSMNSLNVQPKSEPEKQKQVGSLNVNPLPSQATGRTVPRRYFSLPRKSAMYLPLTHESSPSEVKAWLQSKGFDTMTVNSLGGLNGAQLFMLQKDEFKGLCPNDGARVYSQVTVQKSQLQDYSNNSELEAKLNMRRKKFENEIK